MGTGKWLARLIITILLLPLGSNAVDNANLATALIVNSKPFTPFRESLGREQLRGLISLILVSSLAPSEVLPPCTFTIRTCTDDLTLWLTGLSWWFFQSLLDASVLAVQSRLPILLPPQSPVRRGWYGGYEEGLP